MLSIRSFLIHRNKESGFRWCFLYNKGEIQAWKRVLVFVLFFIVKDIFCTRNLLDSIFLRLLNCCTQSALSGRQDFERRCWVCYICDIYSWILTGVSFHEYLLVLYLDFIIQKMVKLEITPKEVIKSEELWFRRHSEI